MATQKQIRDRRYCECSDPGCPVHKGASSCKLWHRFGMTVYRSDMDDRTGTKMCSECASDALDSGVFYTK